MAEYGGVVRWGFGYTRVRTGWEMLAAVKRRPKPKILDGGAYRIAYLISGELHRGPAFSRLHGMDPCQDWRHHTSRKADLL